MGRNNWAAPIHLGEARACGFGGPKHPKHEASPGWAGPATVTSHLVLLGLDTLCFRRRPSAVVSSPPGEMGFVGDTVESIRSIQVRHVLSQIISLGR